MNWFWIVAGMLMIVGGAMHTIIGEQNVISHLAQNKPQTDFSPDQTFNLIRWFWYLGSFISFWVGGVAFIIGLTDWLPSESMIGWLLTSIMFGFSILSFVPVIWLNPKEISKLGQVTILIVVTVLLGLGSL